MKKWKTLKKQLLKDKKVYEEYQKLKPKYAAISQLIALRQKQKISQSELAQKIGTHQSAIARFESGNVNPTLDFIEKLASALGGHVQLQIR